ncbi:MAG: ATP-dependent DNA helicase [Actinomycetota bacterium]
MSKVPLSSVTNHRVPPTPSADHDAASADPSVADLLAAAIKGVGGQARPGQAQMAEAVATAARTGEHLLVQAGTGTGKSLAYLVPAIAHAMRTGRPVVVATATLALQSQVIERDLPRVADAVAGLLGRRPIFGVVKGRFNYVCQHKLLGGYPDDTLFTLDAPTSTAPGPHEESLLPLHENTSVAEKVVPASIRNSSAGGATPSDFGHEVLRLRAWAEQTETGDRDDLTPGVSDRAWRQVAVSAHECLGQVCPMVEDCFTERARLVARASDVVVTNHAMVAIDSFEGRQILPPHDVLIVDEGHELVDRVTSVITDELTPATVERAARRASSWADPADLQLAVAPLRDVLSTLPPTRLEELPETLVVALTSVRDAARHLQTALKPERGEIPDGARQLARAEVDDVFDVADRFLRRAEFDVMWVVEDQRRGSILQIAPLTVAGLLRERLYPDRTVIFTSATLELGGGFETVTPELGLVGSHAPAWRGLDVGSPFDYPRQGILYCARHIPPPTRSGTHEAALDELVELITAAGGRTLGLFSSRRAARDAAQAVRERLDVPVLCQGDDQLPTLVRSFLADPTTCLFGTMSLWQGVDAPGATCTLVVIDRIPFPRPDDPVLSARARSVESAGGNGFLAVSASYAGLRLAQGAGRLVRSADDRGVVAVLDSRMVTARYGGFLRACMPPLWPTTDRAVVMAALRRLDDKAINHPSASLTAR